MPLDAGSRDAIPLKGGYRVETVKGTVRVLGPGTTEMSGTLFAYIKLDTADGRELLLEKVGVGNSVSSELVPDVSGAFHLVRTRKGAFLVAFQGDNGRRGDDVAELVRQLRRLKRNVIWGSAIVSIVSPLSIIGAMIPFFSVPVLVYYLMKSTPSEADIRAAIGEAGRQAA